MCLGRGKINLGRGDRKGFGRRRNLSTLSLEHFPIAICSLKQMIRRLFIHQVESSSDEFPSCANCDRNEKTPMFFCNTCGQFWHKYLTKTTPKFASSPAKTQKSKCSVSCCVVLWCVVMCAVIFFSSCLIHWLEPPSPKWVVWGPNVTELSQEWLWLTFTTTVPATPSAAKVKGCILFS